MTPAERHSTYQTISDLHKDMHGFRPRQNWKLMSDEELMAWYEVITDENQKRWLIEDYNDMYYQIYGKETTKDLKHLTLKEVMAQVDIIENLHGNHMEYNEPFERPAEVKVIGRV